MSAHQAKRVVVMVGTSRGGFVFTSVPEREEWEETGPGLPGAPVFHMTRDPRTGRIYAAVNHPIWGPEISHSDDLGVTRSESSDEPRFGQQPGGGEETLEEVWHVTPGRPSEPGVLYAGGAPASLWRSDDSGDTWRELSNLRNHPSRPDWVGGKGGLCLHTILLDPEDSARMYVGISAVGVFRTDDAGESWNLMSEGVEPAIPPRVHPGSGRCPHKVVMDPVTPATLFQQNHMGVYRSRDAGGAWQDIGAGLPSAFGFPITNHPARSETIYTVPLDSDNFRGAAGGALAVWRSRDGGDSWRGLTDGLPQSNAYLSVMREGLAVDGADPLGLYLGTSGGHLYASRDEGDSWEAITTTLPNILSVEAAVIAS